MEATEAQPYHHGDLKRVILEAAFQMIEEQQDWQFTLREVARRSGVSHSAPYNHFADKAALLSELAVIGFERLDTHLRETAVGATDDVTTALVAMAFRYLEFVTTNPALYRLMYIGTAENLDAVYGNERTVAALDHVEAIIRRGQELGTVRQFHARSMAAACWAHIHGLAMLTIQGFLKTDGSDSELVGPDPLGVAFNSLLFGLMSGPEAA